MTVFGKKGFTALPGKHQAEPLFFIIFPDLVFYRFFMDFGSHFGSDFRVFSCFLRAIFEDDFRMDFSLF